MERLIDFLKNWLGKRGVVSGLPLIGLLLVPLLVGSCRTTQEPPPPPPGLKFSTGDRVIIKFSGPRPPADQHAEEIKGDGTISPPYIGSVKAAGKKPGELQKELTKKYAELYENLTVTVNAGARYIFVDGQVRSPDRYPYSGEMTVVDAIATAGGFTSFAAKKRILLRRSNGEKHRVNYFKAFNNDDADLPVYPGDQIFVPKRWL